MYARRGSRRGDDDRRHALRRRRARRLAGGVRRPRSRMWAARPSSTSRCGRRSRRAVPIEEVGDLVDAGAAAFKLSTFETHPQRFPRIPDAQLLRAFAAIAQAGGLAGVHAENDEIVRAGIAAEQAAGHGADPLAHARSRPPVAEHEAIARCLELARATGVRLHVCHVSTPRGVELVDPGPPRRGRRERRDLPPLPAARRDRPHQVAAARPRSTRRCARRRCPPTAWTSSPPTTSAGRPSASTGPTSSRWPPAPPASS